MSLWEFCGRLTLWEHSVEHDHFVGALCGAAQQLHPEAFYTKMPAWLAAIAVRNYDITALTLALALAAAGTAAQPGTTKMPGQGERTPPCSSHDQCSGDFFCDFDEGQCRNCCFSAARVEGKCQVCLGEWCFCLDVWRDVRLRVPR